MTIRNFKSATTAWFGTSGAAKTPDGQPVRFFVKEVIRKGLYRMPKTGGFLEVDDAMLDNWAGQFGRMVEAGHKVHVPEGHSNDPSKNRGWVDDLYREGDSLKARIALAGDAAKLTGTNDVSIFSQEKFTDGKGNEYAWPITHVALTPVPVVPGLKPFEPVELSFEGKPVETYEFSTDEGEQTMDPKLQELCTKYGIKASTDEEATAAVEQMLGDIAAAIGGEEEGETNAPEKPEGVPPKAVVASHELNPQIVKLAKKNRTLEIDQLVSDGHITRATADDLKHVYASDANIALSLDENGDDMFEAVMASLRKNTPTKSSGLRLNRAVALSHDGEDRRKEDKAVQSRLLGHLGQKTS